MDGEIGQEWLGNLPEASGNSLWASELNLKPFSVTLPNGLQLSLWLPLYLSQAWKASLLPRRSWLGDSSSKNSNVNRQESSEPKGGIQLGWVVGRGPCPKLPFLLLCQIKGCQVRRHPSVSFAQLDQGWDEECGERCLHLLPLPGK